MDHIRKRIYEILKVTNEIKDCENECPLYKFCLENESICKALQEMDNKLLDMQEGNI